MRNEFQYSVVRKIIRDFDEAHILSWLNQVELENLDEYILYQCAHDNGKIKVIAKLMETKAIAGAFSFVSDLKSEWVKTGDIAKLEYPQINTRNLSFKEVIRFIAGEKYNQQVLKKFGELVISQGIRPLNHFSLIQRIYGRDRFSLPEFLRLDHSLSIPYIDTNYTFYLDPILASYSLSRCVKLMRSASGEDFKTIYDNVNLLGRGHRKEMLARLPKKPRSLEIINDFLIKEIAMAYPPERALNQKIAFLDKKTVIGLQIWVPSVVSEIRDLAVEFENCLLKYIGPILDGETYVLILQEDGISKYAVEVATQEGKLVVRSIKGKKNSHVEKAHIIRDELYKLFDSTSIQEDT